jgi:osmotically-inducible protein OsmY
MVDVSVQTDEGTVTLTGRVENEMAHHQAVSLARDTEGVRSVRDRILVEASPNRARTAEPAAEGAADEVEI